VTVRIEDILQRIRRDIESAAREGESDATPVDADALPAISSRPELEYLNRNWSLFDPLSEMRSHRRLLGPVVLRFKWMFRRLVLGVLDRYFEKERLLLLELVRFNNALAERSDRLLREVTERTKAVAERNDLFLGALDLRVEALEARDQMARGLERAPRPAPSAEDSGEELRAEMAAALGGDVGARVRGYTPKLPADGRIVVLGCGAGDVLEALRETTADLHGVESSAALVRQCRARGFDAELAPLRSALESLKEDSLSGLVVTLVTDRHPEDGWPALVAGAWRSLRPGGVAIFEGIRGGGARLAWLLARQRFSLLESGEAAGAEPPATARVIVARRREDP
jgi:O-antigen chain-terminating methyltransferase